MAIELSPVISLLSDVGYTSNTPTELADLIGLRFSNFDKGEARFQEAIDSARAEILFRLGRFTDTSYPELTPTNQVKLEAAQRLCRTAEYFRAAAILYRHYSQREAQYGESGSPISTGDGMGIGAFTPERNVSSAEYNRRANDMQEQFENLMALIVPNTNKPVIASASGRSNFTSNRTFWGRDEWT